MLTGRSPHPKCESGDLLHWHAVVTRGDPPPPSSVLRRSAAAAQRREARRLRGDLDNVVLNALRAEAHLRYRSAGEFADDLERYLGGLTVRATPQTWRYRAGKFVRRNRIGVGAGIAAAALAAVGVVGITYHARVLSQERDRALAAQTRAESAHKTAERVSDFLQSLLESARPDRDGDDVTVRHVLARAATQLAALKDEPDVEATLRTTVGNAYVAMGDFDAAEPHLVRALALRRAEPPDPIALGEACNNLSALRYQQQRYRDAARLAREAVDAQRSALPTSDPRVCTSLNNLAAIERRLGRLDEAERLHRQVLATRRRVLGEQHADVAQSLNNLAMVLIERNRLDDASEALEQALHIRESLFGREHPESAQALYNLGVVDQRAGRLERALERYEAALAIERAVFDEDHPAIALTLGRIGTTQLLRGAPSDAVGPLREALRISERILPPGDLRIHNLRLLRARALAAGDGRTEAIALLREAARALDQTVGPDHSLTKEVKIELARLGSASASNRP
ncbi:MAG: hypothetical protein D6744_14325 [Planctomycetota bacterium]|nr:MAG: hypothetical protein D6744_14325 [Planctomycetota bacterium]